MSNRIIGYAAVALLTLIMATPGMAAEESRRLKLVSTEWSPFTNPPGQPRFALDLVEKALERIGVTIDTVLVDEARLTPSLLKGEYDGGPALWRDAERERVLLYSEPYLENRLILVGIGGSDVSAISLADLAGKRIALISGYSYGEEIESASGPIFVGSSSLEDSIAKVLSGEVDYTLMDELVVQHLVINQAEEVQTRLTFGSTPFVTRSLHLAVQRSLPDAEWIISRFNEGLASLVADRSYHHLLYLDWIRTDIDGDGLAEFVPRDDQVGPNPPEDPYDLFTLDTQFADGDPTDRFYLGGDIYDGWSAVPDRFIHSEFDRATREFTLFTFQF